MNDEYTQFYILSFFNKEKITSVSQILHIFHAKRTPSMFYVIEINDWHHGFALTSTVNRDDLEKTIQILLQKRCIIEKGKGYILTSIGKQECSAYFKSHYFPQKIKTFINANVRQSFWNRLQLFIQVFSELSYKNAQYTPVIKHPHHQESVRQLFQQFPTERDEIFSKWVAEQSFLFEKLEINQANVLASQLTGHGVIGGTASQIATELQMMPREFYFYLQDAIEILLQVIRDHEATVSLTAAILKQVDQEENFGLSASTRQTYELIKKGETIEQIARRRSIKENTVYEHILEMAFIFRNFPSNNFIPENIYTYLHKRFDEKKDYDYRQAMEENDAIKFMHFRLVELERMRMK